MEGKGSEGKKKKRKERRKKKFQSTVPPVEHKFTSMILVLLLHLNPPSAKRVGGGEPLITISYRIPPEIQVKKLKLKKGVNKYMITNGSMQ